MVTQVRCRTQTSCVTTNTAAGLADKKALNDWGVSEIQVCISAEAVETRHRAVEEAPKVPVAAGVRGQWATGLYVIGHWLYVVWRTGH